MAFGETVQAPENADGAGGRELGMTLVELVVSLWIISILSILALSLLNGRIEQARLARCMTDLRSVQSTIWTHSDGITFLRPREFWQIAWAGRPPGPYFYFPTDFDRNAGHGNDVVELCDPDNPGNSKANRDCRDVRFVILCQHNHANLAKYVYIEDEGPPKLAGWTPETNPGWDTFVENPPDYYK